MSNIGNIVAEIISSKVRVKILKLLVEKESLNISAIVRGTRLNYRIVKENLDYLVKRNVVYELVLGRIRVYRLNYANPVARAIRDLFTS
ncbi:MAG: helix-turn-helix transcriptional regulator [Sulfolobales archaeon]|nr:ArsR family transcriptional regulator [Sulfolobales archaeon]MDW8082366.1 helix-turn-helix transcriptional regulator [Sulfolobales archaeon]